MRFYPLILLFMLVVLSPASAAPAVVASIKPVHALLSGLMQGVAEPDLLMAASQSPHHYSLKPSERRMLAQAELVFWIGPGLESFMPRLVESLERQTVVIRLIDTDGLILLPLRAPDEHGEQHVEPHRHDEQQNRHDPHIWLHTHNMDIIAAAMMKQLVKTDPANKTRYENNYSEMKRQISTLRQNLHQRLDNTKAPFLTYHDGYQYFEKEFGLNNAGFISTGADLQPGARHIQQLKTRIREKNIQCVFYESPAKPPMIRSLLNDSTARSIALDATGMSFPAGKDNLYQTMQSIGANFSGCLQAGSVLKNM